MWVCRRFRCEESKRWWVLCESAALGEEDVGYMMLVMNRLKQSFWWGQIGWISSLLARKKSSVGLFQM